MLPLIIKPAIAALSAPLVEQLVAGGMPRPQAMALWVPGGAEYVELGAHAVLRAGDGRRRVRPARRLPDRPPRPAPRADLQHPALRAVGVRGRLRRPRCRSCWCCAALVFVGVCVEFVAAVAWLAELFDDPKQRERVLGYTQAFSSVGGILVAGANVTAAQHRRQPAGDPRRARGVALHADLRRDPGAAADRHPAVPAGVAGVGGQARRPASCGGRASRELFGPGLARTTIVTTIVFAASYGIAFGAIQQLPQILGAPNRGHVEIVGIAGAARRAGRRRRGGEGTAGAARAAPARRSPATPPIRPSPPCRRWQEMGGLAGRAVFALHRGLGDHAGARCCASSRSRR